jgi:hypothetical protein
MVAGRKDSGSNALEAPGEVPPLSSSGATPDRVSRIECIYAIIERLKGTPDRDNVIEDERANLEAFIEEDFDSPLTAKIKSLLK